MAMTDNYRKHTTQNPLQQFLIERFFTFLLQLAQPLGAATILDVGCGEGFTLNRFKKAQIGVHLEGVDFSAQAITLGQKEHPFLQLRQGDIYKLPYNDNNFELVLCTEVLEHLIMPDKALAELRRVTQNYILISVPNEPFFQAANFLRGKNWSRWGNDIEHIQHWSSTAITQKIAQYFQVQIVKTPFPWTIVLAKK